MVASLRAGGKPLIDARDKPSLFKHLLDLEVTENPGRDLMEVLPIIEDDYAQVRDFFFGMYQRNLIGIVHESHAMFLTPDEKDQLQREAKKGNKEASQYIVKTVSPRLEPLWFFVISLCRALQDAEYPMEPEEACWAGLVDEITGTELPWIRSVSDFIQSSNEPHPPSEQSPSVTE